MARLYATMTATAKHASKQWEECLAGKPIKVFINNDDHFYCDAPDYGCSRYYQVTTAHDAVSMFLREHGYYLIRTTEIVE